jgi:hypothetical protein
MSLSLYRVPDGQKKGQSFWPCPSVHSLASALGSLSSVALSSAPAIVTLTSVSITARKTTTINDKSSGSFHDATILTSRTFSNEATGRGAHDSLQEEKDHAAFGRHSAARPTIASSLALISVFTKSDPRDRSNSPPRPTRRPLPKKNLYEETSMNVYVAMPYMAHACREVKVS